MIMIRLLSKNGYTYLFFLFFACSFSYAQSDSTVIKEINNFQLDLNHSYQDSTESPLLKEDLVDFESLNFYPIHLSYRVVALLKKDTTQPSFEMTTSTSRKPKYKKFGMLEFVLLNKSFSIPVYQNIQLMKDSAYVDYLFFPFTDLSNGDDTYGGGRYIDLKIPKSDTLILDFNQCYQPYCAYNHKYSCPIPPIENHLDVEILAGVRNGMKKIKKIYR